MTNYTNQSIEIRPKKFRAYSPKEHKMYGVFNLDNGESIMSQTGLPLHIAPQNYFVWLEFIGLTDKNGRDIFEGDILRLESWNPSDMQVCFVDGAFCLCDEDGNFVGDIHYIHHAGIAQSEVIGNIFGALDYETKEETKGTKCSIKILRCQINEITDQGSPSPNYHYSVWDGDIEVAHGISSSESWVKNDAGGYHTKEKFDKMYPEGWEVKFDF